MGHIERNSRFILLAEAALLSDNSIYVDTCKLV